MGYLPILRFNNILVIFHENLKTICDSLLALNVWRFNWFNYLGLILTELGCALTIYHLEYNPKSIYNTIDLCRNNFVWNSIYNNKDTQIHNRHPTALFIWNRVPSTRLKELNNILKNVKPG